MGWEVLANALAAGVMSMGREPWAAGLAPAAAPPPGRSGAAPSAADWLAYANQGATRNDPLSPQLIEALSFLPEMGLRMEVFSGGQEAAGQGGSRTGSVRHDGGNAGDVFIYDARTGRRLDWNDPNDVPVFQEIVRRARANGLTGFGAGEGYMRPGSIHMGFGNPAVWGAGGRGANAPAWLREAGTGRPAASPPAQAPPQRSAGRPGQSPAGMDWNALGAGMVPMPPMIPTGPGNALAAFAPDEPREPERPAIGIRANDPRAFMQPTAPLPIYGFAPGTNPFF